MLVAQLSPQAVSFPRLPSAPLHPSMSTSPPAQNNSTSVFNALGSYADRIKSPTNNGNSLTINGISTAASISGIPSSTMGPTKSETRNEKLAGPQDEGQWETVQVGRHRPRGERRPGGTGSRFGRERPVKEPYAEDSGRRGPEARAGKKATSSSAPPSSTSEKPAISRAPVIPSVGPKSAWGIASPIGQRHQANSVPGLNLSSSAQTPKKSNARPSQTEPSSPSHASTTATNTSASVPASMASPNLSAETASSSTAPTSIALRGNDAEEEGSWRSRSLDKVEEPVDTLVPKQAPPTAVNAWDIKINSLAPAAGVDERTAPPDTAPVLQFGTVTLPLNTHGAVIPDRMTNGDDGVKIAKKKKAVSAPTSAIVAVDEAWPDVAQAAEMVAEGKKEKVKEKKESEESSVADDASVTGSAYLNSRCDHADMPQRKQNGPRSQRPSFSPLLMKRLRPAADRRPFANGRRNLKRQNLRTRRRRGRRRLTRERGFVPVAPDRVRFDCPQCHKIKGEEAKALSRCLGHSKRSPRAVSQLWPEGRTSREKSPMEDPASLYRDKRVDNPDETHHGELTPNYHHPAARVIHLSPLRPCGSVPDHTLLSQCEATPQLLSPKTPSARTTPFPAHHEPLSPDGDGEDTEIPVPWARIYTLMAPTCINKDTALVIRNSFRLRPATLRAGCTIPRMRSICTPRCTGEERPHLRPCHRLWYRISIPSASTFLAR